MFFYLLMVGPQEKGQVFLHNAFGLGMNNVCAIPYQRKVQDR